eukprot:356868-Chlamydomonas_euryale.AAC.2
MSVWSRLASLQNALRTCKDQASKHPGQAQLGEGSGIHTDGAGPVEGGLLASTQTARPSWERALRIHTTGPGPVERGRLTPSKVPQRSDAVCDGLGACNAVACLLAVPLPLLLQAGTWLS